MRNYLLLLAALVLAAPASAQVGRGTKLIGTSIGRLKHTFSAGGNSETAFALYPSVGWFVGNRVVLGTGVLLGYDAIRINESGQRYFGRTTELGLTPFGRYYPVLGEKHALFVEAGGEVTKAFTRISNGGRFSDERAALRLMLGYNYFLASNAALELKAGYRRNLTNYLEINIPGELALQVGFSVFLHSAKPEVIKD